MDWEERREGDHGVSARDRRRGICLYPPRDRASCLPTLDQPFEVQCLAASADQRSELTFDNAQPIKKGFNTSRRDLFPSTFLLEPLTFLPDR